MIKEAFLGQAGRAVLLCTFASDVAFQQHYFLAAVEDHGCTMVTLDEATVPFRTPAVKRSVAAATRALEGT